MCREVRLGTRLAGVIFTLALALMMLVIALERTAYDADYYRNFQRNNAIVQATGRTEAELDQISEDIIRYLQTGETKRMTDHFGSREVAHMADVFQLFRLAHLIGRLICPIILVLLMFWAIKGQRMRSMLFGANVMLLILFVGMSLLAMVAINYWDTAFTTFHHIFFDNDLWLLNPDTDLMIQMMPTPFFVGMALRIALKFSVGLLAIMLLFNLIVWATHRRQTGATRK